jgi:hypothetical protein
MNARVHEMRLVGVVAAAGYEPGRIAHEAVLVVDVRARASAVARMEA